MEAQKRKERCVPYDLCHAYAIRARETTTWNYADVAAVMGHSQEVHRRTYLSEITGEETRASVVRWRGGCSGIRAKLPNHREAP